MVQLGIFTKAGLRAENVSPSGMSSLSQLAKDFTVEVTPATLAKQEELGGLLPSSTAVYVAFIEGTREADIVASAGRLRREGFEPMPHIPARLFASKAMLSEFLKRLRGEADVRGALLLAGGSRRPAGEFDNSMQLVKTGLFDVQGFERLHFAGHPEGNKDIDPTGGTANVDAAIRWKHDFSRRTDAKVALVTQFVFDAQPVIAWAERLADSGIDLPIHVGLAGPAKLQTLLKYALACGVGPSLSVLQKRATDLSKLLLPYSPDAVAADLASYVADHPESQIKGLHLFPLGGLKASTTWATTAAGDRK